MNAHETDPYPQVRKLADRATFAAHLDRIGAQLPLLPAPAVPDPLAAPVEVHDPAFGTRRLANRFAILPMEGWDGTADGEPTDLVERRWRNFGASGAALVWGGEAVAVRHDGRANPRQLVVGPHLGALREQLVAAHHDARGTTDGLLVGLQLTHSGRYARPGDASVPLKAHDHPVLDARVANARLITDDELDALVDDYEHAARVAADAGFDFVDVKACHGYLGHDLLAAHTRAGRYGGSLEGRTRFLRTTIERIRRRVPGIGVGVRLSVFDVPAHQPGDGGRGEPVAAPGHDLTAHHFALGGVTDETHAVVAMLRELGVQMLCMTAGSPYWCPHVQRPAYFPPSDGYLPPEDPLLGVARLLGAARDVRSEHADMLVVASGVSYLQEWLPDVARATVALGWADVVGIGRLVLSYPTFPADVLAGRPLDRRHICRTFSDCTTAPRRGLVSGCYPLDEHYKAMPERRELAAAKREADARFGRRRA